ncbi:MAG: hypothetical protein NVSMB21_09180 [Vulcanimicrobiaceae bacterium]
MRRSPISRILYRSRGGSHLSRVRVAADLDAMELVRTGRPDSGESIRAILLRVGFTREHVTVRRRRLLPSDFTLASPSELGGSRFVSVALSFELPRQDVILHAAS